MARVSTKTIQTVRHVYLTRTVARKFSIGGLCVSAGCFGFVRRGLTLQKLTKSQLIYNVSCFSLGGLGAFLGGLSPQKPPWDGTVPDYYDSAANVTNSAFYSNCVTASGSIATSKQKHPVIL